MAKNSRLDESYIFQQLVKFIVVLHGTIDDKFAIKDLKFQTKVNSNSQHDVTWNNSAFLEIFSNISSQLGDFSHQVLENASEITCSS